MIENRMVIGDYYDTPRESCVDEDAAYERWRDENEQDRQLIPHQEETAA